MMNILRLGIDKLRQLNLFLDVKTLQEQNMKKIRDQILATRVYLFLFITSLIMLVLFNSITTKIISETELEPTLETYDRLYAAYPKTLSCSCKTVAMKYHNFISMDYIQHPVCTSDLISSKWINSLVNSDTSRLSPLDFRLTAAAQFRLLKAMCSLADNGVKYLRRISLEYSLLSSKTMSRQSINSQLAAVVAKFNGLVQISLLSSRGPELIMTVIRLSRINSAVHTDAFHFSEPGSDQYEAINNFYPRYDNTSYNNDTINNNYAFCTPFNTATYKAGIYDWSDELKPYFQMMNPSPSPRFIIPGMNVGCLPYDAISSSTLKCFFSSECLNTTAKWISNLSPSDWPKPLDSSQLTKFSLNSTIKSMLDEQMVDQWNNTVDFATYYQICTPTQCTYTFVGSANFLYVFALIIGLVGSLNIGFRIVAPLIIQCARYIAEKLNKKRNQQNISSNKAKQNVKSEVTSDCFDISVSTIELDQTSNTIQQSNQSGCTSLSQVIAKMKHFIVTFNLFEDNFDASLPGIYATYIYVILLVTSVIILGVYSLLTVQKYSITVNTPSLSTYESLYETYSKTLICPCSELAVTQENLLIFSNPVYHQICSSVFLTPVWLDGFFTINYTNGSDKRPIPDDDFRKNGILFLESIMTLCKFSQEAVEKSKAIFVIEQYFQGNIPARLDFESHANVLFIEFRQIMKQTWQAFVAIMRILLVSSGLEGGIQFQPIDVNGKISLQRYLPAPSAFNVCACSVARTCPDPTFSGAQFLCYDGNNCTTGNAIWSIPGFIKACTTFDSLLGSDLRCFFNQTCVDTLLSMYNVDMPNRQPLPSATVNVKALNHLTLISFLPTDTLEKLFNNLMIDDWQVHANFEGYYNSCAPASCSYTISQRLNIFYTFTMVTTYFGGLVVTFRLLVPICVGFVYWMLTYRQSAHPKINNQRSTTSSPGKSASAFVLERKIRDN